MEKTENMKSRFGLNAFGCPDSNASYDFLKDIRKQRDGPISIVSLDNYAQRFEWLEKSV